MSGDHKASKAWKAMMASALLAEGATDIRFGHRHNGKTEARFQLPGVGERFITYSSKSRDWRSLNNKRSDIHKIIRNLKGQRGSNGGPELP